jgi:hypothetical protein
MQNLPERPIAPDPLESALRSAWNAAGPGNEEPYEPAANTAATTEPGPITDRMRDFRVEQAEQLLADIANVSHEDTLRAYNLLGQTSVVVRSLLDVIGGGERP